ncbi:MAG: MerR family transcriptional regulator [Candidatus Kapabacteria bacterium]|nr:MerR family transcriptional regulator [Candidatus Kapabacteria bacterium]
MGIVNKNNFDPDAPLYGIGVVAEMLEVSVHLLRLYESEGLVIPFKKDSKHRLYSQNDIIKLECIRDSITNKKFSIASIKTLYSMIPCWSIKRCSGSDRENCEAYTGSTNPCWMYKHKSNVCEAQECRTCEVYKSHNRCDAIKESIKMNTRQL